MQRYVVVNGKIVAARCLVVMVRIWAKLIGARLNRGLSEKKQGTVRSQVGRVRYTLSKRSLCKLNFSRIAASYAGISCQDVALGFSSRRSLGMAKFAFR